MWNTRTRRRALLLGVGRLTITAAVAALYSYPAAKDVFADLPPNDRGGTTPAPQPDSPRAEVIDVNEGNRAELEAETSYLNDEEWPIIRTINGKKVVTRVGEGVSADPKAAEFVLWTKSKVGEPIPPELQSIVMSSVHPYRNPDGSVLPGVHVMVKNSGVVGKPHYILFSKNGENLYVLKKEFVTKGLDISASDYFDYIKREPPISVTRDPMDVLEYGEGAERWQYEGGKSMVVLKWEDRKTGKYHDEVVALTAFQLDAPQI
jgi:hypothetical protein